jgi:hypothetical protein
MGWRSTAARGKGRARDTEFSGCVLPLVGVVFVTLCAVLLVH